MATITPLLRFFQTATNLGLLGIFVGALVYGGAIAPNPLEQLEARGALVGVVVAAGYVFWSTKAQFRLQMSEIGSVMLRMVLLGFAVGTGCAILGGLAHTAGMISPETRTSQAFGTLAGLALAVASGTRDVWARCRRDAARTQKYARFGVVYPPSF
jgi:hypothetical protein